MIVRYKYRTMKKITYFIRSLDASLRSYSSNGQNSVKKSDVNTVQQVSNVNNKQFGMVNDNFMNNEQALVSVREKIYYGCYPRCVSTLKNDAASRFVPAPATGEKVEKAGVFISMKPGSKNEVLYFKSETTAKKYLKSHRKH